MNSGNRTESLWERLFLKKSDSKVAFGLPAKVLCVLWSLRPRNRVRLRRSAAVVCEFLAILKKNSRRLELSVFKNIPHGRWGRGPGSVDPRFPAGLPFPVPEILEFAAFRGSGNFFQQFSRDFTGVFLENPRTDPGNSHSLLEFSEILG